MPLDARKTAASRGLEVYKGKESKEAENDDSLMSKVKAVAHSFKIIFTNPIVLISTVIGTVELGSMSAITVFLSKYIQFQFSRSAAYASMITGKID